MKKVLLFSLLCLSLASPVSAVDAPVTEEQKTLYAVGLSVAKTLSVFDLTAQELEMVQVGINDGLRGKTTAVDIATYTGKVQDLARARRLVKGTKQAAVGKEFLEKAAKEKGAEKTASGMVYLPLAEGKGDAPAPADTVKVNYRGSLIDGKEFDSSYKRGKPMEFMLSGVIKCWTEGVQKMKVGGKAKLFCPPELAYGNNGVGDMIMPGATLVFEVELLEMRKAEAAAAPRPGTPASGTTPAKTGEPLKPALKTAP